MQLALVFTAKMSQDLNLGCLDFRQFVYLDTMLEREREREVTQSCPTLSEPLDCSLPGSSVHGIFQARVLEWGAIAFSIC